mmetsp:Transcript_37070/g.93504  ORF Transcript_37070/g.93504 Transcript_37070/m.93504 type:complete len:273 (+) Transcript_37070:432-1250(+)
MASAASTSRRGRLWWRRRAARAWPSTARAPCPRCAAAPTSSRRWAWRWSWGRRAWRGACGRRASASCTRPPTTPPCACCAVCAARSRCALRSTCWGRCSTPRTPSTAWWASTPPTSHTSWPTHSCGWVCARRWWCTARAWTSSHLWRLLTWWRWWRAAGPTTTRWTPRSWASPAARWRTWRAVTPRSTRPSCATCLAARAALWLTRSTSTQASRWRLLRWWLPPLMVWRWRRRCSAQARRAMCSRSGLSPAKSTRQLRQWPSGRAAGQVAGY